MLLNHPLEQPGIFSHDVKSAGKPSAVRVASLLTLNVLIVLGIFSAGGLIRITQVDSLVFRRVYYCVMILEVILSFVLCIFKCIVSGSCISLLQYKRRCLLFSHTSLHSLEINHIEYLLMSLT